MKNIVKDYDKLLEEVSISFEKLFDEAFEESSEFVPSNWIYFHLIEYIDRITGFCCAGIEWEYLKNKQLFAFVEVALNKLIVNEDVNFPFDGTIQNEFARLANVDSTEEAKKALGRLRELLEIVPAKNVPSKSPLEQ